MLIKYIKKPTLLSVTIASLLTLTAGTLIGEYIISRPVPSAIQTLSVFGLIFLAAINIKMIALLIISKYKL